ncbi:putative Ig domain-containing protein [Halobacteriovorax sp. JY17]|uniref:putative Ig domain-containing protein n=1 Tax=Halobacteriovorax sp. JY17 TaxID=2014617 RepID=UPI0025BFCCCE|nr:putative Ig domain-containing protein [Halobacteriovorax sp. JY17]
MKTLWKISTFLVLLFTLTACMPDSLTKFKESPTKKGDDTTSSSGGSGETDPSAPVDEIVTVLSNLQIPQFADAINGDLILIQLETIGTLKAGDTIYSSATMFKTSDRGAARVLQVAPDNNSTSGKVLARITLGAISETNIFRDGYFIDNCSLGYANCSVGSSTASRILSTSLYFDPSGAPSFSRTITVDATNPLPLEYGVQPNLPLGVSLNTETGEITAPVVPFTIANTFDFSEYTFFSKVTNEFDGEFDDPEEVTDAIFKISSRVGTQTTAISNYNFDYKLLDSDRILLKVANTTGIYANDVLYSCISTNFTSCNTNTEYTGIGTVYYVDTANKTLYINVDDVNGAANPSQFLDGYYLHKSNGSLFTVQTGIPSRLYNSSTTGISFSPEWEVDPVGDGITPLFNIDSVIPGLTIDANSGVISLTAPIQLSTENQYTVTAIDSSTGESIASYVFKLGVFDPPSGITYSGSSFSLGIGKDSVNLNPVLSPVNFADTSSVYYSVTGALVAGVSFSESDGIFTGSPTAYDPGTTVTIEGYYPRAGSTPFASTTINFKAGTPIDEFYYPQLAGEYLQLTVGDARVFTLGDNVSSSNGATGVISYIDAGTNQVVIQVSSTLTGAQVFKRNDFLDNAITYSFLKTQVADVVHIFNSATGVPSRLPTLYNDLSPTTLSLGEVISYDISPTLPSDFTMFNSTTGEIDGDASLPLSLTTPKTFVIQLTNSIGEIVAKEYKFLVKSAPIQATIGRYQFIRISQNFNNFYIGSRFQTSGGTKGRVVHKIGNSTSGGLLVDAQGTIEAGEDIDNVIPYYAAEARVQKYLLITLKNATTLAASNIITTTDGDTAQIQSVVTGENKVYALVSSGDFSAGEIINAGTATETIVMDVVSKHYASHILRLTDASPLEIGGYISSNLGLGSADVIFKEDTNDYAYIQQLSGEFRQAENFDNTVTYAGPESTISRIIGPIVKITSSGNAGGAEVTSSTNSFIEGSTITAYQAGHKSSGIVLNTSGNDFIVDVKDIKGTNSFEIGNSLDDATPFNIALDSANTVTAIATGNVIPLYVGEETYIEGKIKGVFSNVKLTPETLPQGLSFDGTTGVISGTPNEPQEKTTYTITYSSPGDADAVFTFELVTYNQFELIQETEQASSYILHKEGQGYGTTSCKILSSQVSPTNTSKYQMNDIVCRLEGQELDLYNRGAALKVKSGAGMCEYVRYIPEAHKSYPTGRTRSYFVQYNEFTDACMPFGGNPALPQIDIVNPITGGALTIMDTAVDHTNGPLSVQSGGVINFGEKACVAGDCLQQYGKAGATNACQFNHTTPKGDLKCDEGSKFTSTVSCEEKTDGYCACVATDWVEEECGGNKNACISGGIRSTGLTIGLENSEIVNSFAGVVQEFTVKSPQSYGLGNNTVIANTTRASQCRDVSQNYAFDSYDDTGILSTFIGNYSNYNTTDFTASDFEANVSPNGGNEANANKFYEYHCLDAAFNVKARIRLQIRDWDKSFNPETPNIEVFDNGGAISNIDDSTTTCFGLNCDQKWDWDTLIDALAAASKPNYTVAAGSCSRGAYAAPAGTVRTTESSTTIHTSLPLNSQLMPGMIVKVGTDLTSGGEFRYFTVESVSSDRFTVTTPADMTLSGLDWEIARDFPFPMDHTN